MKPCTNLFTTISQPFSRPLQALILSCAFTGPLAAQTSYYFDNSDSAGINTSGGGTWSTSVINWSLLSGGGGTRIVWPGGSDIANFTGTGSAIIVNESISLSRLNATGGFSFSGSGGLNFGSNAGVIDTSANISTFSIGLAGSNGITKSGSGTFTYTGTGTYTGALTVSGGTFTLGDTTATTNRLSSASGLVIGSATTAGTFTMAAATGGTNVQTFTNLGVGAGVNTLASSGASASNMASVTFSGNYTRSNNGILGFTNATGYSVTANFANTGENIIDGILVGVNRSNNTFVANNNTANGAPTSTNNVWSSGTHTVATSNNGSPYAGTTASLRLSGTRTVTLGSGAIINTGMIANNGGSATGTITGGTLTSGNGKDLILIGGDSAYRIEIASQIVDFSGSVKTGLLVANATGATGNLISGNNSYTGDTTLAGSFTIAGHNNAFGTTGKIIFAGGSLGASMGSSRMLSNNIEIVAATANLNGLTQSVVTNFGGVGATYDLTLSGNISGSGTLSLNNSIGTNKVTLSGNNSAHTGTVIVNNAATTLALGSANAIGTGVNLATAGTVTSSDTTARSVTITNYTGAGGTFGQSGTGDLNVTLPTLGAIAYNINIGNSLTTIVNTTLGTGSGATLAKNGTGTLALAGTFGLFSNLGTGLTLNAGAIQYGTGGATGFLDMTGVNAVINGTAVGTKVIFNRSNELSVAVPLTGSLGVEQVGAGVTTLTNNNNTYSGATTVAAGALLVNNTSGSGTGTGTVTVASGLTNATAVRLGGSGTISGATSFAADPDAAGAQVGGIHSPGAPSVNGGVGKQTFTAASNSLTYNTGSIFEWQLGASPLDNTSIDGFGAGVRGTDYDAVNATTLGATTNAIFRVVLNGSQNFSETFWMSDRRWSDIFKTSDAGVALDIASIFTGGFQYYNGGTTPAELLSPPSAYGSFSISGTDLNWTAIPEPTSALAGLLLTAGLLRRRR